MTKESLIKELSGLKVQTGSLCCLGCGHEHNCSIRGCAILREALEQLTHADYKWISVEDRLPEPGCRVIAANKYFVGECWIATNGTWYRYNGFDMDHLLDKVTHWMPLPEPPEGENTNERT